MSLKWRSDIISCAVKFKILRLYLINLLMHTMLQWNWSQEKFLASSFRYPYYLYLCCSLNAFFYFSFSTFKFKRICLCVWHFLPYHKSKLFIYNVGLTLFSHSLLRIVVVRSEVIKRQKITSIFFLFFGILSFKLLMSCILWRTFSDARIFLAQ